MAGDKFESESARVPKAADTMGKIDTIEEFESQDIDETEKSKSRASLKPSNNKDSAQASISIHSSRLDVREDLSDKKPEACERESKASTPLLSK